MPDELVRGIFGVGSDVNACGTARRATERGNSFALSRINVRQKAVVG
jgi:ribosomal protein S14